MSKISQNKEKKRLSILEAAREVFLSDGFIQAGMDKIAAQAGVTKQTVYRYYASKEILFQAMLVHMGSSQSMDFASHLQDNDPETALCNFAESFIHAHLADDHLALYRLIVAENSRAPELTRSFFDIGPDDTNAILTRYLADKLDIADAGAIATMWTAILLAHHDQVVMGQPKPDDRQIRDYAAKATKFLLSAIR